jgi:hypothetical protein
MREPSVGRHEAGCLDEAECLGEPIERQLTILVGHYGNRIWHINLLSRRDGRRAHTTLGSHTLLRSPKHTHLHALARIAKGGRA